MSKKSSKKQRLSARKVEKQQGLSSYVYVGLAVAVVLIAGLSAVVLTNGSTIKKPTATPVPTQIIATAILSVPGNGVVNTTADGLKYEDLYIGMGQEAHVGDTVVVMYTGTMNGVKFESTYDSGNPFTFTLGKGSVIKGWDEGIVGMKVGGTRRITIPPELGYGDKGNPPKIPPNATLVFDIGLEGIR